MLKQIQNEQIGGVFKIDWICKKDLSFTRTVHLFNSWNENKLIKIGRDGQEIEPSAAQELCRLFAEDKSVNMTPILRKSKATSEQLKSKNRPFSNTRDEDDLGCDDFRAIRKPLVAQLGLLARSENPHQHFLHNSHHERDYGSSGSRSRNHGHDNSQGFRTNRNPNLEVGEMPPPIPSFYLTKLAKSLQTKFPDISDNSLSSGAIEACLAKFMQSMSSQFPPLPYLPKPSSRPSSFMSSFPLPPPPPPPPPPIPIHHVLGDDKSQQIGFQDRSRERRRDRDRSRDRNYDNNSSRSIGNLKNRHRDHDRRIRERKRSPDWHRDRSQSNRSSRSHFDDNNKHYRSRLDDRRHSRHHHNDF